MATLVIHSALVPAAAASTQSLYNSRSVASRVWMKKRNQSLSTKIVQKKAVLRCCATLPGNESEQGPYLKDLQVPEAWAEPSVALQEAEWLRGALHQWLDEEYCPEPANVEISKRCSKVYYYCLMEQQVDIGDILMQMVRDLETFSFKESFHGAFSSANAAIALITKRMEETQSTASS